MTRRRFKALPVLVLICVVLAVIASSLTIAIVKQGIGGQPQALVDDVSRALVAAFVLSLIVAIAVGIFAGRFFLAPLARLHDDLTRVASGERVSATAYRIREFQQIGAVIDGQVAELRARLVDAANERDELLRMIQSGKEGLLHIGRSGRIIHVNDAARRLLRLPPDARGQQVRALIRQQDLRLALESAAAGSLDEPRDIVVNDRQLVLTAQPVESGALLSIMDLTEIRRLENVRRDFVANVSHELKTPLTSIRGYAETLLTDELPDDMRRQFAEVIYRNTVRIQRIVDDLLDLSRLQSGGWTPEMHDVNAAEIVEDVWATCREAADRRNIEFALVRNDATHVLADSGGLRQILSNLFDNAIRYTPEGGRITVRIERVNDGSKTAPRDQIEIRVQDNGSGIPREALSRIFERFYRVDPARSRNEGGTGLGLSIVKHLVERMNGSVHAESELGKGTTIRVRLPAA